MVQDQVESCRTLARNGLICALFGPPPCPPLGQQQFTVKCSHFPERDTIGETLDTVASVKMIPQTQTSTTMLYVLLACCATFCSCLREIHDDDPLHSKHTHAMRKIAAALGEVAAEESACDASQCCVLIQARARQLLTERKLRQRRLMPPAHILRTKVRITRNTCQGPRRSIRCSDLQS